MENRQYARNVESDPARAGAVNALTNVLQSAINACGLAARVAGKERNKEI
jgi:hypothetical protein